MTALAIPDPSGAVTPPGSAGYRRRGGYEQPSPGGRSSSVVAAALAEREARDRLDRG